MSNQDVGASDTTDYADIDFSGMSQYADQDVDFFFDEEKEYIVIDPKTNRKKVFYLEQTPEWNKWKGYYNRVPFLDAVITRKAVWAVGQGFKVLKGRVKKKSFFESKQKAVEGLRGNGTDNFESISWNMLVCADIAGNAFAEIIKDTGHRLKNLKPLNPGTMTVIANKFGIIKGYRQTIGSVVIKRWKPNEIFHLPRNRVADWIIGAGIIEKMDWTLRAMEESKTDQKVLFHRYVKPLWIFKVKSDKPSKINEFKAELNKTLKKSENMVIPAKTVESTEMLSIPQYSTLDPLPWLTFLHKEVVIAAGVPEIVLGVGADTTEASSKILYLAYEALIKYIQRWYEAQLKIQVGLEVKFDFPATLEGDLRADNSKDGPLPGEKPSELKPGVVQP